MVTINTQYETSNFNSITFRYLVELTKSGCVFGSARDNETGRTRLFLVFNTGRVYARNGLKNCWDEVNRSADYDRVRRLVTLARAHKTIPCYVSAEEVNFN